jgi:His-Xaa-Ser system radical SAM maturase HxsC
LRQRVIGRIASTQISGASRADHILMVRDAAAPGDLAGYAGVLCSAPSLNAGTESASVPLVTGVPTGHLVDGDVVAVDQTGYVRTLYRRGSPSNFLFTTDRCNSYCVMCSQPPKPLDDGWRVLELLRLIELIDGDTSELCITGGEPTLLKDDLARLLRACRDRLPKTAVHVLSNGRLFYYGALARRVAEIDHPDVMFGIPLYSDLDWQHDHVVQSRKAFDHTLIGLQNLGRFGVPVEVRVVIHRWTVPRLVPLADFIYRNVTFASHVALMGLEPTGFAIPNLAELWIDPCEYREQLEEATLFLAERGMSVSIYNHQLCTVPERLWPYCRRSISDWKNEYLPVCAECTVQAQCGGFFTSGVQRHYSRHITPIR